jgi:hypothetical protein
MVQEHADGLETLPNVWIAKTQFYSVLKTKGFGGVSHQFRLVTLDCVTCAASSAS